MTGGKYRRDSGPFIERAREREQANRVGYLRLASDTYSEALSVCLNHNFPLLFRNKPNKKDIVADHAMLLILSRNNHSKRSIGVESQSQLTKLYNNIIVIVKLSC